MMPGVGKTEVDDPRQLRNGFSTGGGGSGRRGFHLFVDGNGGRGRISSRLNPLGSSLDGGRQTAGEVGDRPLLEELRGGGAGAMPAVRDRRCCSGQRGFDRGVFRGGGPRGRRDGHKSPSVASGPWGRNPRSSSRSNLCLPVSYSFSLRGNPTSAEVPCLTLDAPCGKQGGSRPTRQNQRRRLRR